MMAQSDDSEKICKKYLELYPDNIKYLYQENQGSNIARNKGIKLGNSFYQFIHDLEKKMELEGNMLHQLIKRKLMNYLTKSKESF